MRATSLSRLRRAVLWLGLDLLVAAGLLAFTVWADTAPKARMSAVDGCYCSCGPSKASGGCAKMCDLPKYATRRWAVTCAKPRATAPQENPGAGPRLPRPSRSERASN